MQKQCLIYLFIGMLIGALCQYAFGPKLTVTNTVEKPVITEKVVRKTDTQIAYVPKETTTIKYIDKTTGKEVTTTATETTDIQAAIAKPSINVKLNDKEVTFYKTDDEAYVLEKNKIALTQTSSIDFNVKVPTVDKTKHNGIGVGMGDNGLSIMAVQKNSWEYFDKDTKAAGMIFKF